MSDKAFFDWWIDAFDPECDAMALKAWNAATALKNAEMAPILAASRYTCDLCTQALDTVREQTAEIAALRKAGQQALDALDSQYPGGWANDALKCHWDGIRKDAITSLRQAIAKAVQP